MKLTAPQRRVLEVLQEGGELLGLMKALRFPDGRLEDVSLLTIRSLWGRGLIGRKGGPQSRYDISEAGYAALDDYRGTHPNSAANLVRHEPGPLEPSDPYRFSLPPHLNAELKRMDKSERDEMMTGALEARLKK